MYEVMDIINRRESCRGYQNIPVEKEVLLNCIEAARLAPSACNSQPWSYYVVNNPQTASAMAKFLQEDGFNRFTDQCSTFIIVLEEPAQLINGATGEKMISQRFASIDIGLSVMQLCLQATAQGLSTCIMGSFNEEKIKHLLQKDWTQKIRLVIAIGYAKSDTIRKKIRKPLNEIVTFDQ